MAKINFLESLEPKPGRYVAIPRDPEDFIASDRVIVVPKGEERRKGLSVSRIVKVWKVRETSSYLNEDPDLETPYYRKGEFVLHLHSDVDCITPDAAHPEDTYIFIHHSLIVGSLGTLEEAKAKEEEEPKPAKPLAARGTG